MKSSFFCSSVQLLCIFKSLLILSWRNTQQSIHPFWCSFCTTIILFGFFLLFLWITLHFSFYGTHFDGLMLPLEFCFLLLLFPHLFYTYPIHWILSLHNIFFLEKAFASYIFTMKIQDENKLKKKLNTKKEVFGFRFEQFTATKRVRQREYYVNTTFRLVL